MARAAPVNKYIDSAERFHPGRFAKCRRSRNSGTIACKTVSPASNARELAGVTRADVRMRC